MATQSVVAQDNRSPKEPQEKEEAQQPLSVYACPTCKLELELRHNALYCRVCAVSYPIFDRIPDFMIDKFEGSSNFSLRLLAKLDSGPLLNFAASVYETWIYPFVCNVYGGWRCTSLEQLAQYVSDIVGSQDGLILDVACGPGTYGRRIASPSKTIYGMDACMSMLRQGARYVDSGRIPNVHFAHALVEALPFPAGLFDAAICAGSLNHFSDTVLALREINRTMKAGAPLAVMCFAAGTKGLMKHRSLRERAEKRGGHIFELPDLERYVAEAGFEDLRPHLHGSVLVFSAQKK